MSTKIIIDALVMVGATCTTDVAKIREASRKSGYSIELCRDTARKYGHTLRIIRDQRAQISDLQKMNEQRGPVTMNEIEAQELVSLDLLGLLWKRADEKCRQHCVEVFGTEQPTVEMLR